MNTQYLLTILILCLAVAAMMYFGHQRRTDVKKPLELTPRLKKRIVEATIAVGVEDAARHYELSTKTVRRLRVTQGVEAKTCATCENFSPAKGAEAIQAHNIMLQVTKSLTPAVLGQDKTNTQSWSDFGACAANPGCLMGSTDWCGTPVHVEKMGDKWA